MAAPRECALRVLRVRIRKAKVFYSVQIALTAKSMPSNPHVSNVLSAGVELMLVVVVQEERRTVAKTAKRGNFQTILDSPLVKIATMVRSTSESHPAPNVEKVHTVPVRQ